MTVLGGAGGDGDCGGGTAAAAATTMAGDGGGWEPSDRRPQPSRACQPTFILVVFILGALRVGHRYQLSPGTNIGGALKEYGADTATTDIVLCAFDADEAKLATLSGLVCGGTIVPPAQLGSLCDMGLVSRLYVVLTWA